MSHNRKVPAQMESNKPLIPLKGEVLFNERNKVIFRADNGHLVIANISLNGEVIAWPLLRQETDDEDIPEVIPPQPEPKVEAPAPEPIEEKPAPKPEFDETQYISKPEPEPEPVDEDIFPPGFGEIPKEAIEVPEPSTEESHFSKNRRSKNKKRLETPVEEPKSEPDYLADDFDVKTWLDETYGN